MDKLEHRVEFTPAYDKRDPNPSKNYGIHGVNMKLLVIGEKGVVQFVVCTNWHLPHVQRELEEKPHNGYNRFAPLACQCWLP